MASRKRRASQRPVQPSGGGAAAVASPAPAAVRPLLATPLLLTAGLFLLSFAPRVQQNPIVVQSFWGTTAVLIVWLTILFVRVRPESVRQPFRVDLRAQHYIQAMCQLTVYAYWGWYWRPVYDYALLWLAQLVFAYAFGMLLAWSRRESYVLGFGPFPIVASTNLFLWFRDDWFYLQFLLIAVGFLGKEFVRWQREGRRVHIFNPSAFSLGLFSLVLIATGTTGLTRAQDVATTLTLAPHIYLVLFLVGLVVMYFFSITLVAGFAAITLFGLSALYGSLTGVPYFIDSEIPAAVFLGLHLLVTDPSTSPRTPLGRSVFGVLYGLGVFGLYSLLTTLGAPTFYDKLLCVPLLNLSVQRIDQMAHAVERRAAASGWTRTWAPSRANLAYMAIWIVFFGAMTMRGATDGMHWGDRLPFWQQACSEGRRNACARLLRIEASYCADNSGWACNELGAHYVEGQLAAPDAERALTYFSRACEGRFQAGCVNLLDDTLISRANPRALDLRLLLREAGRNLIDMPEPELYARACTHGWAFACARIAQTN